MVLFSPTIYIFNGWCSESIQQINKLYKKKTYSGMFTVHYPSAIKVLSFLQILSHYQHTIFI